jgi:hypothetical protein
MLNVLLLVMLMQGCGSGGNGSFSINALDDLVKIDEDSGTVNISILANDKFLRDLPYSVLLGEAQNGLVSISDSHDLSYTPASNFNGSEVITYTLLQENKQVSANIIITVNPVNDAPIFSSTNFSVYENEVSVGTVTASDVDGDTLVYSIAEGVDGFLFNIDPESGVLNFVTAPNYEVPLDNDNNNAYEVGILISDGFIDTSSQININVLNLSNWYKGNTHTHSEFSFDSQSPLEDLMAWYKENQYSFVVVTDHNYFTDLYSLNSLTHDRTNLVDDSFILIPGEELTARTNHVNGLNISYLLSPSEEISDNFHEIIIANGLAQLNHPYESQIGAPEIVNSVQGIQVPLFIEIFNSVTDTKFLPASPSEDLWDAVLSTGTKMWGVAVDDSHTPIDGPFPPGGGFIYVDADSLDITSIMAAMNEGRFYASSGATISNFLYDRSKYSVETSVMSNIKFIGAEGVILKEVNSTFAEYEFTGNEQYIRARIESESGVAWTQPVFVNN